MLARVRAAFIAVTLLVCSALALPQVASAAIPDIVNDPLIRAMFPINELRDITGYNGPRTYLFIGQNSYELRTTGGFISRVGLVKFENGNVQFTWLKYTYDLDHEYGDYLALHPEQGELPPYPLGVLGTGFWYLRDRNWYPDFKVSAQDMQTLFSKEATAWNASAPATETIPLNPPYSVDGVIAVDESVGSYILGATGPVTLDDPGEPYDGAILNADNFGLYCQWYETSGLETGGGRKFFQAVSDALRNKMDSAGSGTQSAIAMAFIRALADHHIQMYSNKAANQAALEKLDWAGRALPLAGDFLHISDTNIGGVGGKGNKVNMYIRRSITKGVTLYGKNGSSNEASMTYYNAGLPGYFNYFTDPNTNPPLEPDYSRLEGAYYRGYTRAFVPSNAELDRDRCVYDPNGFLRNILEGSMSRRWFGSWSGFTGGGLAPGQTQTISYRYTLPSALLSVSNGYIYRLQVQKQAGTNADQFRLNVSSPYLFVKGVTGVSPNYTNWHYVRYLGDLQYDKLIQVVLTPVYLSRPAATVRAGRYASFRGYMSPYHARSPAYFEVYRRIGRRYVRVAVLRAYGLSYNAYNRRLAVRYRVPARGYYKVRLRAPGKYRGSFVTGYYAFTAR